MVVAVKQFIAGTPGRLHERRRVQESTLRKMWEYRVLGNKLVHVPGREHSILCQEFYCIIGELYPLPCSNFLSL